MSIGTLVAFESIFLSLCYALTYITQYMPTLAQAAGAAGHLQEVLREPPTVTDAPDAKPLPPFAREIEFRDVSFSYTGTDTQLAGLSVRIPCGSFVAFVGGSGAGKSTVLNLLLRFYDPTSGAVRVDGHDLRDVTLDSLRGQTGIVFQESLLFNLSVRENIRLGHLAATDEQVEQAARLAEIHDAIVRLPHGYGTPVGERGGQLSGGQRQRIAIARALVRDPRILILDEATSALDPVTEAAIHDTLLRLRAGRTVIAVTHRLGTVTEADVLFVLDHGRLVESGRHEELLIRGGVYARLWSGGDVPSEPEA
jgi:ATP-binding cassette subfamily B protein